MEQTYYREMENNLESLIKKNIIQTKAIYLFGHCNATEELVNLLQSKGFYVTAILDNNPAKQGRDYQGIPIQPPNIIISSPPMETLVCIVARAYAAMTEQLNQIGYKGQIEKL